MLEVQEPIFGLFPFPVSYTVSLTLLLWFPCLGKISHMKQWNFCALLEQFFNRYEQIHIIEIKRFALNDMFAKWG